MELILATLLTLAGGIALSIRAQAKHDEADAERDVLFNTMVTKNNQRIDSLEREQVTHLEAQAVLKAEIHALTLQLAKKNGELVRMESLQQRVDVLERRVEEMKLTIETLRAQKDNLQDELQVVREEKGRVERERDQLRSELAGMKAVVQSLHVVHDPASDDAA